MVSVAQLVERWIVAPVVVGSIPITHPNFEICSLFGIVVPLRRISFLEPTFTLLASP